MTITRERLHRLVEHLAEADLEAAAHALERLIPGATDDPVQKLLTEAPLDDEPLTEADLAAHAEGLEQYRRGQGRLLEPPLRRRRARA